MTDRIEAIRARWDADPSNTFPSDVGTLLAEVKEARDDAAHFEAEYDDAVAELERMHSWGGLLSLMDEHWPEDVFPDRTGKPDRDTGPRLVAALRRVDRLTKALEEIREDLRQGPDDRRVRVSIVLTLQKHMGVAWLEGPDAPDAEPEMLGGDPNHKYLDATYPTDGEQPGPDWRPLSEDVTGHTLMGPARSHADGRVCMYHTRLDAWTWDFVNECLRDHEDPR